MGEGEGGGHQNVSLSCLYNSSFKKKGVEGGGRSKSDFLEFQISSLLWPDSR